MNPQAEELNKTIEQNNPVLFNLLSKRGKEIFFPKKGILGQSADAKDKKFNATIGTAIEDDGSSMRLNSIEKLLNISPELSFPYASSFGRLDLRERWHKMMFEKNPSMAGKTISTPVVTNALTHGLSMAAYMFADEGETIIVSDHFWGNYNLIFTNAYGIKIDKFTLFAGDGLNLESIKAKLNEGKPSKKILLLNFPNNPSGYTPTFDEMHKLTQIIKESAEAGNQLVIMIDDAYFGLVFEDGIATESIFAQLTDVHENVLAVKIDGPTKEDYVWGFRVGFITYGIKNASKEVYTALENKTAGAVRGNISNASNLSQSLLLQAFNSPTYWDEKQQKYNLLKSRYEKVKLVLQDKKYNDVFMALPYNSGYFMCVELKNGIGGEELRQLLLQKYDTGVIALGNVIRLAFSALSVTQIPQVFDNIYDACMELSKK